MKVEQLKDEMLRFAPAERLRLSHDVEPELCAALMADPNTLSEMMPRCCEVMARHPELVEQMRRWMYYAIPNEPDLSCRHALAWVLQALGKD
jgi:hypothetical protein